MTKVISTIIILTIVFGGWFIYSDGRFERVAPIVNAQSKINFNSNKPLTINVSDNEGLKSYEVLLNDKVIASKNISGKNGLIIIEPSMLKESNTRLKLIVRDSSKWNFLVGNKTEKYVDISVDKIAPSIEIVANSYGITQGGSALVVFKANDENIKELFIQTPYYKFKAVPYKKAGYYASLVAWPFNLDRFSASVVAIDQASNKSEVKIPFNIKNKKYATLHIQATDTLIDTKILPLANRDARVKNMQNKLDKFAGVNEGIRAENEKLIETLSSIVPNQLIAEWKILPFYPLKNGAKVASYGDLRHYYYDTKTKEVISISDHVGIDLASTQKAQIVSSNSGKVVYSKDNGLYGNMPMIDHGFGLYTIYGHCSNISKPKGSTIKAGDIIANSGTSGLALGDHLHFGILVQGNEVAPEEWMDSNWLKLNIDDVFAKANMVIK